MVIKSTLRKLGFFAISYSCYPFSVIGSRLYSCGFHTMSRETNEYLNFLFANAFYSFKAASIAEPIHLLLEGHVKTIQLLFAEERNSSNNSQDPHNVDF